MCRHTRSRGTHGRQGAGKHGRDAISELQLPRPAVPNLVVMDKLVHAARAQRGAHGVNHGHTCIDVADQLSFALASVGALPQQDDLRLLRTTQHTAGVRSAAWATDSMLLAAGGARGHTIIPGIIVWARPKGACFFNEQSAAARSQHLQ